ncbi:hypothetical protein [Ekhidna sp.]
MILCCCLVSQAQTGHYRGQRTAGVIGGIGKDSYLGGIEATLFLGRNYGISGTAGYEIASVFGVDENRMFFDAQLNYNIFNKDSKFYLIGKGGLSFSNDETKGTEQFSSSSFRSGANISVRIEQFVSSQLLVLAQGTQKFFFDGEERYAVTVGLNYIF